MVPCGVHAGRVIRRKERALSEPFLAEIRMVGFNFAPRGWALCDGQILPINQNQSLYSLLGSTYGGDGRTSFALPDLRGRVPVHVGQASSGGRRFLGDSSGEETHSLAADELPAHRHSLSGSGDQATLTDPAGAALAGRAVRTNSFYTSQGPFNPMKDGFIGTSGQGQAHENIQPFLAVNFAIALRGLFPPRN